MGKSRKRSLRPAQPQQLPVRLVIHWILSEISLYSDLLNSNGENGLNNETVPSFIYCSITSGCGVSPAILQAFEICTMQTCEIHARSHTKSTLL